MYRCSYGACVNRTTRCNGLMDCIDGSDEIACNQDPKTVCSSKEFQCSTLYQECIPLAQMCNGLCLYSLVCKTLSFSIL